MAGEAAVRLHQTTKRFGSKTAVDEVSLAIEPGSVFGLIGPNGAGKTTTFSMLAGYLRPTSGSIEVLGFAPTNVDPLRGRLGVLPQDAVLPPTDTVGDFLVHMARLQDLRGSHAEEAARRGLEEVSGRDWWGQRCSALSHGMAKRVAIAQAFLGSPEVVLLDEPTAGLDPRVAWEVRELLVAKKEAQRGRLTIIVSSHNLQELEAICDAAAILDRGKVVGSGTMAELTAANEEVRIEFGAGTRRGTDAGQVPLQRLRDLPGVKTLNYDDERRELVVSFERRELDAEAMIGQLLGVLLQNQARISGVSKGRGLEQRVMDLT